MGELGTRWILAGLATCAAGWFGTPDFAFAASVSFGWAALSTIALKWDRTNRGRAGLIAGLDALAVALILSAASRLGTFGWVAVLPALYAINRYRSNPLTTMAVVSGAILTAHLAVQQKVPNAILSVQLVAILICGLALRKQDDPAPTPSESVGPTDPLGAEEPETLLGLRESFRQLKTLYRNLQWKSRRDHVTAALLETKFGEGPGMMARLSARVAELTGAKSVRIYAVSADPKGFAAEDDFLRIDPHEAVGRIKHRAEQLLTSVGGSTVSVALATETGVLGLCTLQADPALADDVRTTAEELAPTLSRLISEAAAHSVDRQQRLVDRLRLDWLVRLRGSVSASELGDRTVDVLFEAFHPAHISLRYGGQTMATRGGEAPPSEWTRNREDLVIPDATQHPAISPTEAIRLRVGSLLSIRIGSVQIVMTGREGQLDVRTSEMVKGICADLDWALDEQRKEGGLVGPDAFRHRMSEPGILVLFETGKAGTSQEEATSALRGRTTQYLPSRGAAYIREDGDVLIHLPGAHLGEATQWALKVAEAVPGTRVRTASLWPRTSAVIAGATELDEVSLPLAA